MKVYVVTSTLLTENILCNKAFGTRDVAEKAILSFEGWGPYMKYQKQPDGGYSNGIDYVRVVELDFAP